MKFLLVILLLAVPVYGQTNKPVPPTIPADKQLELRTLQYEQSQQVVQLQRLELEFKKAQAANQDLVRRIGEWIQEQFKIHKLDDKVYAFDISKLQFVLIDPKKPED